MRHLTKTLFVILLLSGTAFSYGQSEADMKAYMEYMTPGEVHKMLAKFDGEWTADMNMWMAPGAPPTKTTSSCVNRMILGGRYQESKYSGNMNGMPFEGISTTAYDNSRKVFIATWIDNFGTGIMVSEGTWDNATKSLTMKGKQVDPVSGKDIAIREVMKTVDDNTQTMEMYMTPAGGTEYKSMEIKLTRKK